MTAFRIISAAICGLIALVWIGQGLGFIRGSVMTDNPIWSVAGLVLLALVVWQVLALLRVGAPGSPPRRKR